MAATRVVVENELFCACVKHIFANWTALTYAVQMGQGGMDSAIKAEWMVGVVHKFFYENDDLYPDEVEDFIADILNAEFDTIADDGSLVEISEKLCRFFRLYKDDKHEELLAFLKTSPKPKTTSTLSEPESSPTNQEASRCSPLETNFNEFSLKSASMVHVENGSVTSNQEVMDTDEKSDGEEEWKTIIRGRSK